MDIETLCRETALHLFGDLRSETAIQAGIRQVRPTVEFVAARVRSEAVAGGEREALGRAVRAEWMAWAQEQPRPKPPWLVPWDELAEPDREVDRRIGERLYGLGRAEARAGLYDDLIRDTDERLALRLRLDDPGPEWERWGLQARRQWLVNMAEAAGCPVAEKNPFLPDKPTDGLHSFQGPTDLGGNNRCKFCGAYQGSVEAESPCEGEFRQSGKMRAWAADRWRESLAGSVPVATPQTAQRTQSEVRGTARGSGAYAELEASRAPDPARQSPRRRRRRTGEPVGPVATPTEPRAETPEELVAAHAAQGCNACQTKLASATPVPAVQPETYDCRDDHGDARTRVPHTHAKRPAEQPEER